jgi:hypothetical protein
MQRIWRQRSSSRTRRNWSLMLGHYRDRPRWTAPNRPSPTGANIRPLGKVVTRDDLPQMTATAVGVQLIDDPMWVINPAFAIAKGKTFTLANRGKKGKKG